jgi:cyclic lactone autoinducer peptide
MNKITSKIVNKMGTALSSAALTVALTNSNSTCWFTSYQPVEPKGLRKFDKK